MKVWGIGMIVVLLASLLVVGATPAAAGTQAYSAAGVVNPGVAPLDNQILNNSDVAILEAAPNGDLFAVDNVANPDTIYKSVDHGRTWVAQTVPFAAGTAVADIAISPGYETDGTIFALLNTAGVVTVTRSTNGGATFAPYAPAVGAGGTEIGMSLALEPTYVSGVGGVMVGTADTVGGAYGDVYTWNPVTFAWTSHVATAGLAAQDFTSVAYSPNYSIDATLLAVGSVAGGAGTVLNSKVFTDNWNATFNVPALEAAAKDLGTAGAIVSSSMAFPSDYSASIPLLNNFYIGLNSAGGADDVLRINGITTLTMGATDINMTAAGNNSINNVAHTGSYATGTVYAGSAATTAVYSSSNASGPAIAVVWGTAIYPATGATLAYVAVDPANYYQYGLIDTTITVIRDFQPLDATEWYMVTTGGGAEMESLWKTTDGGATYKRIFALATNSNFAAVRLSPYFATDHTMYFTETGPTAGAPLLRLSQDGGNTWQQRNYPTALSAAGQGPADLIVVDQFTAFGDVAPGAGSAVYRTDNNGFYWAGQALTGATAVSDLALDVASGNVLAGAVNAGGPAGLVYVSTDGATWTALGTPGAATGNMVVAFDANYATNGYVYAGDSSGAGAGVYSFVVGTSLAWALVDNTIGAGNCAAIIVTPDGVLYAVDGIPGVPDNPATPAVNEEAGGIVRTLIPTSATALAQAVPASERMGVTNGGLVAGTTLASLASVEGSNMLFSITGAAIVTYTDTLTTAVPAVVSPSPGEILGAVNVVIEPVTNATGHQVQWNTRADWLGAGAQVAIAGFPTYASGALGCPAGSTIYLRVRVTAPVTGPWSEVFTVETQLAGPVAPNAPAIPGAQPAANGGTGVDINPTFYWGGVIGATGYEFKLGTTAGMEDDDLLVNEVLGNVLAYELTELTLEYSTTYYWMVKAISATSETSWTLAQGFTTMAEPAEEQPPVTVTDQPPATIIVELPTPTETVVEEVAQGYIWAIIIIGAVLVIAVIVLIVRTRRSV
jgi:hypothetical protein